MIASTSVGLLLRQWRQQRRLSQLELALEAQVSSRHLSFVENGRAQPSREMILRLARRLEVPLRERNQLLGAAGFAPMYAERSLDAPALQAVRAAVERVLAAHEPLPAIAIDRHWNLVLANGAATALYTGVASWLLEPPVNVLRLTLHPQGIGMRLVNFEAIRSHTLERLRHASGPVIDPVLAELATEIAGYPVPPNAETHIESDTHTAANAVALPVRLRDEASGRILSLIGTVTVFGTPADITVSEMAIEALFPADESTAEFLRAQAAGSHTHQPPASRS